MGQGAQAATVMARQPMAARAMDYLHLLKPRVMSLVVFTGAAGLVAAPGQMHPLLAFALLLAIAGGAGGAGALNMWFDSDIDAVMKRTRTRPIPAGLIARDEAMMLGLTVSAVSVILAVLAGGVIAGLLLAFSIVFYALVYTQWLKRRTAQNIVIGGLAGALPPAIGWAGAAGGQVPLEAWLLVALIFFWTPPHFWALALYQRGDYAAAGLPMMPVTAGAKATRRLILGYSLLVAPLGLVPAAIGLGGWIYLGVSMFGGIGFLVLATRVAFSKAGDGLGDGDEGKDRGGAGDRPARELFAFSILYLFLLFAALLIEHGFGLFWPVAGIGR